MKLITAIIFMCVSGVCQQQHAEIEPKACKIGTLHGKVLGVDATFGVRCLG